MSVFASLLSKKEERKRDEKKDLEAIILKILSNPIYKERLKDDEETMKKICKGFMYT